ncbi:hypothetical protein [Nonlabens xiamenensis]|uniref:hypothetical protein n=1 Tax=Nonlabens xiamenensis TaxID=2341043 RepID=UPI000F614C0B|nr:hypothetical protein [Nonlabens xiamenensis]
MKAVLTFYLICISGISIAQSITKIHFGTGVNNDLSSYIALDYGNYLLNKDSNFNIGAQLGLHYLNFNTERLTKDDQFYVALGVSLKYQLTDKFRLQVDSGTRWELGKSEVSFKDESGNLIPGSAIGKHAFSMPTINYIIHDTIEVLLGYQFVFENDLDLNSLTVGLIIDLSSD